MTIHTANAVRILQAVAMTVGIALFLWSTGLPTIFHSAEAASISNASDTLSTSAPLGAAVHTITFTLPNGMSPSETIEIAFDGAFDATSSQLNITDVSMTVDGNSTTTASSSSATNWGVSGWGTDTMTFTAPSSFGVASSGVVSITIGSSTDNTLLNPPATTSYAIDIGGGGSTAQDSGQVRVAIIDEVTVSANVDTTLTFAVTGLGNGAAVNGTSTNGSSTNVSIPFGTLSAGNIKTLAQRLNVTTNATNGYSVTVEETGAFQSGTGATIDGFVDGSDTQLPTTWQAPGGDVNDPDSYGHWGITSTDGTTTRTNEFSSNKWVAPSTTPIVIMGHTGPADGTTDGVGSSTVGYQVEITALQEAGSDYSTTLHYIATPIF